MEKTIGSIVESCRQSPRNDCLLLRVIAFNNRTREIHGFKPLMDCNPGDYTGALNCGGSTALYDASLDGVESLTAYGSQLTADDYNVNGIVIVITDGGDNVSTNGIPEVKMALESVVTDENLESLVSILVGVNVNSCSRMLNEYSTNAGFTQHVDAGDATPKTLARLAAFVSKSITSQSQAIGTGGPSKTLVF